jgi:hypothetical protein
MSKLILSSSSSLLTGNVIWVDAINGNDSTGVLGNHSKPFLTLEAARTAATSGDLIYVLPGAYTVTTTATNGIAKDGVNYYFEMGAVVTKTNAGDIFNLTGFTVGFNVLGYGRFVRTTTAAYVWNGGGYYTFATQINTRFEFDSISHTAGSSICHLNSHYGKASSFIFNEIVNTAGTCIVLDGATGGSTYASHFLVFNKMKNTGGACIDMGTSGAYWKVMGQHCESTTTYAVRTYSYDSVDINIGYIKGAYLTWYGIYLNGTALITSHTANAYITAGAITLNIALLTYLTVTGGNVTITSTSSVYIAQSGGGVTSYAPMGGTVSAGLLTVIFGQAVTYIGDLTVTGGRIVLIGSIMCYDSQATYGGFRVNGASAEMFFEGDFQWNHNPDVYGYKTPFTLSNGKLTLKGRVKNLSTTKATGYPTTGTCVSYGGGTLIVNGAVLTTNNTENAVITATAGSLNLKVLSGGLSTNRTENGGTLAAKKQKYKHVVTTAATTTTITLNDGSGGNEVFTETNTATYSTKALMAQRIAALINASGTLDITATQDSAGVDEYFYVEADVAGTPFTEVLLTNLNQLFIRANSYAMTLQVGGTIIDDSNVE